MKYQLINPSDPVSFEAPSITVAAIASSFVGRGKYPCEPDEEGAEEVPFFMFGGFDEWWKSHSDVTPAEFMEDPETKNQVIEALKSFKLEAEERSSMNDIVGRAHAIAEKL